MKNSLTKEQAVQKATEMEKEIDAVVAGQYIGMPREELKSIMLTVVRKTEELQIFCYENGLDFHEITGR